MGTGLIRGGQWGPGPSACCSPRQHHQASDLGSLLILLGDPGSLAPLSLHLVICKMGTGIAGPAPSVEMGKSSPNVGKSSPNLV